MKCGVKAMKKFLAILTLIFCLCASAAFAADDLTVHFFDVGKGDCILIQQAGHNVMIDTGFKETAEAVLCELKGRLGVEKLDCLIMSHFDKDHVGGAGELLSTLPVTEIYQPDYEKKSKQMARYKAEVAKRDKAPVMVHEIVKFNLGEMYFTLYPPTVYEGVVSNDFSVITLMEFRGRKFLFMGDALDRRMEYFMQRQCQGKVDLMKLPHHGFFLVQSAAFHSVYDAVKPDYVMITDSKKYRVNGALDLMFELDGVKLFRQRNGAVTVKCDGENLTVEQ